MDFVCFMGVWIFKTVNFLSEWFDTSISFTLLFLWICYDFNMKIAADG